MSSIKYGATSMTHEPKSEMLHARISPDAKTRFAECAARAGLTTGELMRELVTGFVEGRVTIVPPETQKESIYVPRNPD